MSQDEKEYTFAEKLFWAGIIVFDSAVLYHPAITVANGMKEIDYMHHYQTAFETLVNISINLSTTDIIALVGIGMVTTSVLLRSVTEGE